MAYDAALFVDGMLTINDAKDITGTVTVNELGLSLPLTLTDLGDGTMNLYAESAEFISSGRYSVAITLNYTLGGTNAQKSTTRTMQVGFMDFDYIYRSGDSTTYGISTTADYYFIGFDTNYTITAVKATLYDSANALLDTYNGTPPATDESGWYFDATDFTGSAAHEYYFIQWSVTYTAGSGSTAFTETVTSNMVRVDLLDPATATDRPSADTSVVADGTNYTMTFNFHPGAAASVTYTETLVNGDIASSVGYTVTTNISGASGTVSVTGPFDGETEVIVIFSYRMKNSDSVETDSVYGYFDGSA